MILLATLLACSNPTDSPVAPERVETGPLEVRTTSFPADWLVTRLAGDSVNQVNIHPRGEDPPSWTPPGEVVASLAEADLIVANGAGFEAWMATAALPVDAVVYSAKRLDLIELAAVTHSHGAGGEHSHAGRDPHTWSDPTAYFDQARAVHAALVEARPSDTETFDANLATLEQDLKTLSGELASATAHLQGRPLAASHPAFNYLARRFQLTVTSFDFDPEAPPSVAQLEAFATWSEGQDPPVLLWESHPTDAVRSAFAPQVVHQYVDPLESPPTTGDYDYIRQAQANAARLRGLLSATPQ